MLAQAKVDSTSMQSGCSHGQRVLLAKCSHECAFHHARMYAYMCICASSDHVSGQRDQRERNFIRPDGEEEGAVIDKYGREIFSVVLATS
jgi:hypothetical protein